jgi:hypothetical protein
MDDVLEAVETRVSTAANFSRSRVFSYAGDSAELLESQTVGEQFVTCWFESLQVDQELLIGGGPANTGLDDVLLIEVFQRFNLDRESQDSKLLRSKSIGFAALVKRIGKAFQGWFPTDSTGLISTLREPTRVLGFQFRLRKPANGWARAAVRISARFIADLS